jgi:hypothetical protein
MPAHQLIVFVKAPRPGFVKTRLARGLGLDAACQAYRQLVGAVLKRMAPLSEVELRFSPDDAEPEIRPWVRPGWTARPQGDGDLGQRMQAAFAEAFAVGAQRVALIGSDCPEITSGDVRQAWRELATYDVVLGPAIDGGYWLIGLKTPQPALFENVPWGSESVLAETLQRAKTAQLRVQLLRILTDIDSQAQWRQWLGGAGSDSPLD